MERPTLTDPTLTNCTFGGNTAGNNGGGMFNTESSPTVTNSTFSANAAVYSGGGIFSIFESSPVLTSCVFWANEATAGPQIGGTAAVTYSCVEGGLAGEGNIGDDPLFARDPDDGGDGWGDDPATPDVNEGDNDDYGDLHLQAGSPCIDDGDNAALPQDVADLDGDGDTTERTPVDLDGYPRFVDDQDVPDCPQPGADCGTPPIVDMGAYEFQAVLCPCSFDCLVNNITQALGYDCIQDAIDTANAGDEIVVEPGTYNETIDFLGKAITLRSSGGSDVTIIDATGIGGSVVTCTPGLGLDTVLDGFTITGGTGTDVSGSRRGGGMYNYVSSPTVRNCTFHRNSAYTGGGMYNSSYSPMIADCTFSENTADYGAGMYNYFSSPTVTSCTFSENTATVTGGGMNNERGSPAVTNCTFSRNTANTAAGGMNNHNCTDLIVTNCTFSGNTSGNRAGGMYNHYSDPIVTNCAFSGNAAADYGGGMYNIYSSPVLANCTFSGNSADDFYGGAMDGLGAGTNPILTNCILWANTAPTDAQIHGPATVTYSCIDGGWPGDGNTIDNPLFVRDPYDGGDGWGDDPATPGLDEGANDDYGDLRLQRGSPVIDAADNTAVPPDTADLDGDTDTTEPAPLDLDGHARFFDHPTTPDTGNPDGVNPIVDMGAFEWWAPCLCSQGCPVNNITQSLSFDCIQGAINLATDGDEIVVAPGTYNETIDLMGKAITLRSSAGPGVTIIDAAGIGGSVVTCSNGEGLDTIIEGFTITGGTGTSGRGGGMRILADPIIRYCTITGNSGNWGAGMYVDGDPTVRNCTFRDNTSSFKGGGMYNLYGGFSVSECTFVDNTADSGGGIYNQYGFLDIVNCMFNGNEGSGLYNYNANPTITNCAFKANSATSGGGMVNDYYCNPTIINCTFGGNIATSNGGGMYNTGNSNATVANSVFWGNSPTGIDDSSPGTSNFSFCDIQGGWTGGGSDNTDEDPLFARNPDDGGDGWGDDPATPGVDEGANDDHGDLRLQVDSPCIDAGDNTALPGEITVDLDGRPRFIDSLVAADTGIPGDLTAVV
ncbi:MAG: right-handed parallel beta-helix repeat-containing protein, partial [Planctomycetota bacterium]